MKNIKRAITLLRDLPKILYINFKVFDLPTAFRLPIKIKYNVKVGRLKKGCVVIEGRIERFMIKLGYSGSEFISENKSFISIKNEGKIIIKGNCNISEGFSLLIDNGSLEIGKGFYSNKNLMIQCEKSIFIGNNVLLGWNISIRDTDGHVIRYNSIILESKKSIIIEENTWIASDCTILKGSIIGSGSIVGCNSLVAGDKIKEKNCLIVGSPAKIKKNNVKFEK